MSVLSVPRNSLIVVNCAVSLSRCKANQISWPPFCTYHCDRLLASFIIIFISLQPHIICEFKFIDSMIRLCTIQKASTWLQNDHHATNEACVCLCGEARCSRLIWREKTYRGDPLYTANCLHLPCSTNVLGWWKAWKEQRNSFFQKIASFCCLARVRLFLPLYFTQLC